MKKETLFEKLRKHHLQGSYPFHMPGHKRRLSSPGNPYELDITEIDGFDSLHHATGILQEISRRAAILYQAEETILLVNGSTAGLLCAISAVARPDAGDEDDWILVARNCHKSVYHGIYINRLKAKYLFPRPLSSGGEETGIAGGIAPEDVEAALSEAAKNGKKVRAVVITSPTYEGVVSDISGIAECCHRYQAPLIVDEAHGAHFGFDPAFPESAVTLGADAVIQSLHKTMPALTQTGLLHLNGGRIDRDRVRRFSAIYQTSSPSYLLMGSIDRCLSMMEEEKESLVGPYKKRLADCRRRLLACRHIRLLWPDDAGKKKSACAGMDPGRVVFLVPRRYLTGNELMKILRDRFGLELEMAGPDHVTAIVTMMDTEDGIGRLCGAIETLDREIEAGCFLKRPDRALPGNVCRTPKVMMSIGEAYDKTWQSCPLGQAAGRVSAEFIYIYPPGIPIVAPGEVVCEEHLRQIREAMEQGLSVEGPADPTLSILRVL